MELSTHLNMNNDNYALNNLIFPEDRKTCGNCCRDENFKMFSRALSCEGHKAIYKSGLSSIIHSKRPQTHFPISARLFPLDKFSHNATRQNYF